jgi:hypothetical protein
MKKANADTATEEETIRPSSVAVPVSEASEFYPAIKNPICCDPAHFLQEQLHDPLYRTTGPASW